MGIFSGFFILFWVADKTRHFRTSTSTFLTIFWYFVAQITDKLIKKIINWKQSLVVALLLFAPHCRFVSRSWILLSACSVTSLTVSLSFPPPGFLSWEPPPGPGAPTHQLLPPHCYRYWLSLQPRGLHAQDASKAAPPQLPNMSHITTRYTPPCPVCSPHLHESNVLWRTRPRSRVDFCFDCWNKYAKAVILQSDVSDRISGGLHILNCISRKNKAIALCHSVVRPPAWPRDVTKLFWLEKISSVF